jgi:hypothetical protein
VGVLPFADAAARTAAIPTPTDGQFTYLQDTNTPEFYDGSNFVPVGTAPGLVHINTTTFSAVSSVSVDDVFTSVYKNYRMLVEITGGTGASHLMIRLRVAGSDSSTGYQYQRLVINSTSASPSRALSQTEARIGDPNELSFSTVELSSPQLATITALQSLNMGFGDTSSISGLIYFLTHTVATAYDGFTLFPTSGNITGTIHIYGYKNS